MTQDNFILALMKIGYLKKFMHIDAKCLELPFYRAVDIDNKEDWKIAEIFYRSKKF